MNSCQRSLNVPSPIACPQPPRPLTPHLPLLGLLIFASAFASAAPPPPRVIVLGIDGMDYALTRSLLDQGKLPNLAALASTGSFLPLQTSMPPLSPVAWSNFITGTNSGGHAVFDFLRRNPSLAGPHLLPEDAVSKLISQPPANDWRIPFTSYVWPQQQTMTLLRQGPPLWKNLESNNIPATIYKIPANYPVLPSKSQILSGMGTPDIEGTYGLFTYITSRPADWTKSITGGRLQKATLQNGSVLVHTDSATSSPCIFGPINPFLSKKQPYESRQLRIPFDIHLDPSEKSAAICIQDQDIVLKQGEWSLWVQIQFDLLPAIKSVNGLVRFYLQQTFPDLRLFVSPVNLAPGTHGLASGRLDLLLQDALGPYFTKGMPEETKALMQGLFTTDEYIAQADLVFKEELQALDFLLPRQKTGLLFFYISAVDLSSHVLWRHHDPNHPHYDKSESPRHASRITDLYIHLDSVVGNVRSQLRPNDVLYIMSDHGFAPVYHQFNLATWLANEGYLVFKPASRDKPTKTYADVDWSKTRAYALGFQSLYINLKGREATGSVTPQDLPALAEEIRAKLQSFQNGSVFRHIYRPSEIYSGPYLADAPDLLLGYERGFGPSDEAVLGNATTQIITQDDHTFSGSHAMDQSVVPGVLFSSLKLHATHPKLEDLTVTILNTFGLSVPKHMTGSPLF